MTPDRTDQTHSDDADPEQHGVLSDAGNLATSGFGMLGGQTEQISVQLPSATDDDLVDDGVVDDELEYETTQQSPGFDEENVETGELEELSDGEGARDDVGNIEDAVIEEAGDDHAAAPAVIAAEDQSTASVDGSRDGGAMSITGPTPATRSTQPSDPTPQSAASTSGTAGTVGQTVGASSSPTSTGSIPATRREAQHPEVEPRPQRAHAVERVIPRADVTMTSKRLGEFEAGRETADLLTADRLLDPHQVVRPEPEGAWQHFVYSLTRHRINLGDGKRARARKELDRRIAAPLTGGARFVPVLSRKGGVGKTTVTTLLGMALADARDDRVIAVDANPDRGTLAERISRTSGKTVRDLVKVRAEVTGYNDISNVVARDETRLDVLASDADPRVSEALNDRDYHDVASIAAHYYSIILTDTGTGIVHSVMGATLDLADQLVVVAGLSVDEARLASETLTWLETNGYAEQVRNTIVVLNTARPGAPLVQIDELEAHFRTRVRSVVRIPYDPHIAAGSAISFRELQPATRLAARDLAAAVVEGLRALTPAA
ncbi:MULTISPECIES: AAA family ATPase [unclassified Microbacterium]|uniref:MinD/ParA family ATP-binding protein n=2 Tax=unclassified Microbacterium TaxID=2609290 RepID=UPI00214B20CB|nr:MULTISPECIES: AAA family ATPase [unclassified Microbacterium]MCR2809136.1 AAA family ATPase [Microbacterium sp. zg.B185]WIM20288.1 AAA family ATPase [Microbacterium sp. zg-B185]